MWKCFDINVVKKTGCPLTESQRETVLAITARRYFGALCLGSLFDSEFRYNVPPIPSSHGPCLCFMVNNISFFDCIPHPTQSFIFSLVFDVLVRNSLKKKSFSFTPFIMKACGFTSSIACAVSPERC